MKANQNVSGVNSIGMQPFLTRPSF